MERNTSSLVMEKKADPSTSFKISMMRVNEGRFGYSRSQHAVVKVGRWGGKVRVGRWGGKVRVGRWGGKVRVGRWGGKVRVGR